MQYGELCQVDIAGVRDQIVVLPLGSLEQHGHHLPLLTDSIICSELVEVVEKELPQVLFLPLLWAGASEHHRGFPGTISLANQLYSQVVASILECLIQNGFRRIFLFNAHGGNEIPGMQALYDVQMRHRDLPDLWLVFSSWFRIAAQQIAAIPDLQQEGVSHACELETSLIMHLRPQLVKPNIKPGARIDFESSFYSPDFSRPGRVEVARVFEQISATGALGHPEEGTPAKGEAILATAAREVVAFLREFAAWQPIKTS